MLLTLGLVDLLGIGMFKIDHNIPLPDSRKESADFPFNDMKEGDSFTVDDPALFEELEKAIEARNNDGTSAFFVAHEIEYNGSEQMRVWRISPALYMESEPSDVIYCLKFIMDFAGEPKTPTEIIRASRLDFPEAGTRRLRRHLLGKYDCLFSKEKIGKGKGYLIRF